LFVIDAGAACGDVLCRRISSAAEAIVLQRGPAGLALGADELIEGAGQAAVPGRL